MNEHGQINAAQHDVLMRPLKSSRVAKRSQGGKSLSYLQSWDVRAHLIRVFGFGGFDVETEDQHLVGTREYDSKDSKPMVECIWFVKVRLTLRDDTGRQIARYSESAVGSTSGPATMIGEHHDNAVKTAASDALKRCAINLGTGFGLSLYDNGRLTDVVKVTVVKPEGVVATAPSDTPEAAVAALEASLGAQVIEDPSTTETQATNGTASDVRTFA